MSGALNIVDSSGWLEIFVAGKNASIFETVIQGGNLLVPAVSIFEVVKRALVLGSERDAKRIEAHMRRFRVIDLTAERAGSAARLSKKLQLPMADSLIYASALEFKAILWTQDEDFADLSGVKYFAT